MGGKKQSALALEVRGLGIVRWWLSSFGVRSYVEMSRALAARGVAKWAFDRERLTITYYDRAGLVLVSEAVG